MIEVTNTPTVWCVVGTRNSNDPPDSVWWFVWIGWWCVRSVAHFDRLSCSCDCVYCSSLAVLYLRRIMDKYSQTHTHKRNHTKERKKTKKNMERERNTFYVNKTLWLHWGPPITHIFLWIITCSWTKLYFDCSFSSNFCFVLLIGRTQAKDDAWRYDKESRTCGQDKMNWSIFGIHLCVLYRTSSWMVCWLAFSSSLGENQIWRWHQFEFGVSRDYVECALDFVTGWFVVAMWMIESKGVRQFLFTEWTMRMDGVVRETCI